jgi:hypothetical protein
MVFIDGLSPLQRAILVLVYDNCRRKGRTTQSEGCDCYNSEGPEHVWRIQNRRAGLTGGRTPTHWHFGLR